LYNGLVGQQSGSMTRRPAAERHLDSAPDPVRDQDTALADLLIAYHHPVRRWLCDLLAVDGPANVGRLAARTGLAVGSVSHHLKALHKQDLVEPAPELAKDTRESWWRVQRRGFSWSVDDFERGTLGRRVAEAAEAENFRHQLRAVRDWLQRSPHEDASWRRAADSYDTLVFATADQLEDLGARINDVITAWTVEVVADLDERPEAERRAVRAIARVFPSGAVRP
jgi:DNA-binding transcriptional ArsR family regulator